MRRRRRVRPEMDFIDTLRVRRATRIDDVPLLVRLAGELGFLTVGEMQEEADRLHPVLWAEIQARPKRGRP